jgi:hypothetical protein
LALADPDAVICGVRERPQMTVQNFSSLSPEEQLKQAQESGEWFAPTLFITNYGRWGFKFEAECYRHNKDGSIDHDCLNVDSPTVADAGSKGAAYREGKRLFWKVWNESHNRAKLNILKSMSSWGL